jgi:hypothetical protein
MTESIDSSSVSISPAFIANKFQQPAWHVQVNGTPVLDAVLERVDLGFGSDLSSASFLLPKNPLTSTGNPVENDTVEVVVNNKVIFKGPIKVITDHIGSDGLKITYTAFSNIVELNNYTVIFGAFNSDSADYRQYRYNVPPILSIIGVNASNVPNMFPGEVNVTDQTLLAATESILNKVGNYKLYYDMVNQALSVYNFQTGGINTRSFIPGKNIISYDITKSSENVVDQIIVVGSPVQITSNRTFMPQVKLTESGQYELSQTLSGKNIRNVQVEGQQREKPQIKYDMSVKANKEMIYFYGAYGGLSQEEGEARKAQYELFNPLVFRDSKQTNDFVELRPRIIDVLNNTMEWLPVPVSVEQRGPDLVKVTVSDCPKKWCTNYIGGNIPNTILGVTDTDPLNPESSYVELLDYYYWDPGACRATVTIDGAKPMVSQGYGKIVRTINDSQYAISANFITGENNQAQVLQAMQIRAKAEYDRLRYPKISGTITVLGDETIDLRQTILIEGLLLDIVHVTHSFTNGFTTDVTITNEKLVPSIILRPPQWYPTRNADTEKDRRRTLLIGVLESEVLRKNRVANSEKKMDEQPPNGGSYAVLQ